MLHLHFHILHKFLQETAYSKHNLSGLNAWTVSMTSIHINLSACVFGCEYMLPCMRRVSQQCSCSCLFRILFAPVCMCSPVHFLFPSSRASSLVSLLQVCAPVPDGKCVYLFLFVRIPLVRICMCLGFVLVFNSGCFCISKWVGSPLPVTMRCQLGI